MSSSGRREKTEPMFFESHLLKPFGQPGITLFRVVDLRAGWISLRQRATLIGWPR